MTEHASTAKRMMELLVLRAPGLRQIPYFQFWSRFYMRHNQRRLEHLATLNLPIEGRSVLETGAGIGDHTSFFVDRGCKVIAIEPRPANVRVLKRRFPTLDVVQLDLDSLEGKEPIFSEIVYCYGTLYHLSKPREALEFLARCCKAMFLLETCVLPREDDEEPDLVPELASSPSQSLTGIGCRPTRKWIQKELSRLYPYVYIPVTQPYHEEFPIDWTARFESKSLTRAIFVASRAPLENQLLTTELPARQRRG